MNINPEFSIPLPSAWKHTASIPKSFKQQTLKRSLAPWARNYFFTALGLKKFVFYPWMGWNLAIQLYYYWTQDNFLTSLPAKQSTGGCCRVQQLYFYSICDQRCSRSSGRYTTGCTSYRWKGAFAWVTTDLCKALPVQSSTTFWRVAHSANTTMFRFPFGMQLCWNCSETTNHALIKKTHTHTEEKFHHN